MQAAADEAARLEECVAALATRKAEMEEALTAFQIAQREAALGGDGPSQPGRNVERKVERAEKAFDRAMSGAGGASFTRPDGKAAAKVAEIDVIQKSAVIAQRMAALRAEMQAG